MRPLEIDDAIPTTSTPTPVDHNLKRLDDQAEAATKAGFELPATLFAVGTDLYDIGRDNYAKSRRDFESMPDAAKALGELATRVAGERRTDIVVNGTDLHMRRDGQISRDRAKYLPLAPQGLSGLCRALEISGGNAYLANIPAEDRADHLNRLHFPAATRPDARASAKAGHMITVPRKVTMRGRWRQNHHEIWSVVGPRYNTDMDVDKLATLIAEKIPAGAKSEIRYDGYRARINVLFHGDVAASDVRVGEIYKAGIQLTTADDGTESIKASSEIYRAICKNLMTIRSRQIRLSQRHVGAAIGRVVERAIEMCARDVLAFTEAWTYATTENVLERYSLNDPTEVFSGLVYSKAVWVSGMKPEDQIERLKRAWDCEPGYSKAAFLNAITRAAHTETWGSPWTQDELQEQAGELLFAKVWDVADPEATEGV